MQLTGLGLYTFSQGAHVIGAKPQELRRWLQGYSQLLHGKRRRSPPLWTTELESSGLNGLSFHYLLEARFVKRFREYGVSLQTVRIAAAHAREALDNPYPFTCLSFQTDGKTIFLEAARESGEIALLDLPKKQYAFEEIIRPSLYAGIESDAERASRWFPEPNRRDIVLDPTIAFGKPIVIGTNIRTDILHDAYLAEDGDKRQVARQFEVEIEAVTAALRFEKRLAA
ncbi:MAG: DUF433 domain-containing protein [Gammaproteobacteria bacterium]|nr:DUF433 domain-containing protein [Nitrococcus sp.]MDN5865284.1 DUF433 domain-containing protein [Gammaproteobacteria bacterium]